MIQIGFIPQLCSTCKERPVALFKAKDEDDEWIECTYYQCTDEGFMPVCQECMRPCRVCREYDCSH